MTPPTLLRAHPTKRIAFEWDANGPVMNLRGPLTDFDLVVCGESLIRAALETLRQTVLQLQAEKEGRNLAGR